MNALLLYQEFSLRIRYEIVTYVYSTLGSIVLNVYFNLHY